VSPCAALSGGAVAQSDTGHARSLTETARKASCDDALVEKITSLYVAFQVSNNFAEIHIGKSQLKIHLWPIDYVDPRGLVDKILEGYNWIMDRRIYLKGPEDLDYVVGIVQQSYKNVL